MERFAGSEQFRIRPSHYLVAESQATAADLFGTHVIHEKYGRGLILRREGSGDNVKLTISFPGFGQKKLIEKFANLQKEQ